jgi:hypothetical protein
MAFDRKSERELTDTEKLVIARIADMLPDGECRLKLLADTANATATTESLVAGSARIIFHIAGYQRPTYAGQHSFGVEGKLSDKDGAELYVDLYADPNDHLLELEIIRRDQGRIPGPNWSSWVLY